MTDPKLDFTVTLPAHVKREDHRENNTTAFRVPGEVPMKPNDAASHRPQGDRTVR